MIYLDNSATSFPKPDCVIQAVNRAMHRCGNPGRGGHSASMTGAKILYEGRELCADIFDCEPDQVAFTSGCTQGLNIAIGSVVKPGTKVVISGFEHNAVVRPLYALKAEILEAGSRLFDPENMLEEFESCLRNGAQAAVFTHVSNVFGYILPVEEMAQLCRQYGVPFVVDAAQSAGVLDFSLEKLGASFIAMPGHKGLMGPMGTGILLCADMPKPLIFGGTGSVSNSPQMPDFMPDILEPGTANVPGIAGVSAGIRHIRKFGIEKIRRREKALLHRCADALAGMGYQVYTGKDQCCAVSFRGKADCEEIARILDKNAIAVRAGLHCAPLAHKTSGTLETGTVRLSFGPGNNMEEINKLLCILADNREKFL